MTSGAFVHLTGLLEAGQAAEAQCYVAQILGAVPHVGMGNFELVGLRGVPHVAFY